MHDAAEAALALGVGVIIALWVAAGVIILGSSEVAAWLASSVLLALSATIAIVALVRLSLDAGGGE